MLLVKSLRLALKRITGVCMGDYGNDGRVDAMVMDRMQAIVVLLDGKASFNDVVSVNISELPSAKAMVDAAGDLRRTSL